MYQCVYALRACDFCLCVCVRVCSRASGVGEVFKHLVNTALFWLLWGSTHKIASYAF